MLTHIMENSGLVVVGIAIKAAVSAGVVLANISAKETGTPLPCRGMGWHEKSLSYGIFNDLLRKHPSASTWLLTRAYLSRMRL